MPKKGIKREKGKTYVYLVRHAHFIIPKSPHTYNPHLSLSKKGKIQAKALAKRLKPLKNDIEVFCCSTMSRAVETAEAVAKVIDKKPVKYQRLSEFNKLLWTRKYYCFKYWRYLIRHKLSIRTFNKILEENAGKVILIVAHGNVIKGIIKNKLNLSLSKIRELDYKNCHITVLKFNGLKLEKSYCINEKKPITFV